jgi:hypothetical protein
MPLDDSKHQESVKVSLTEREMVDVCRMSIIDDRKPAEFIRHALRVFMYGRVSETCPEGDKNKSHQ